MSDVFFKITYTGNMNETIEFTDFNKYDLDSSKYAYNRLKSQNYKNVKLLIVVVNEEELNINQLSN